MSQFEMQQYREEEERKKNYARQKIKDYRDMLELQSQVKRQIGSETDEIRTVSDTKSENRYSKNYRSSSFNPITREPYEATEESRIKNDKGSEKSLASYGNLVLQARRPYSIILLILNLTKKTIAYNCDMKLFFINKTSVKEFLHCSEICWLLS